MSDLALGSINIKKKTIVSAFMEVKFLSITRYCIDMLSCKVMRGKIIFHTILCMKNFRRKI